MTKILEFPIEIIGSSWGMTQKAKPEDDIVWNSRIPMIKSRIPKPIQARCYNPNLLGVLARYICASRLFYLLHTKPLRAVDLAF